MKNATFTMSYDEEKLRALKIYLAQRDIRLEDEVAKTMDNLFNKNVPSAVREYIRQREAEQEVRGK